MAYARSVAWRASRGGPWKRAVRGGAILVAFALTLALTPTAWAVPNPDIFYPNTTSDALHPSSDCLYQSSAPCSLRDAVILAGNHSVDAYVELGPNTYALTDPSGSTGYLPVSGTVVSPVHKVTITGTTGTVIDDSGNGGNSAIAGGGGNTPYSVELDDLTLTGAQSTPAFSWQGRATSLCRA